MPNGIFPPCFIFSLFSYIADEILASLHLHLIRSAYFRLMNRHPSQLYKPLMFVYPIHYTLHLLSHSKDQARLPGLHRLYQRQHRIHSRE